MVDPATTPTILVYAAAESNSDAANQVVKDIRAYPHPSTPAQPGADPAELWQIQNKYYSAWVKFKHQSVSSNASADEDAPAVIVVAPRTKTPSPALAAQLAQLAAREPDFDVALLVSYATSTPAGDAPAEQIELDEEAWEDVGFEHGFEWVDVNPQTEASGEADGSSGTEEEGIGRVVAALHAHLWVNMVPAERQAGTGGRAAQASAGKTGMEEDGDSGGEDDEAEFASLGAPPLPEPRPFVPVPVAFPSTMLPSLARKKGETSEMGSPPSEGSPLPDPASATATATTGAAAPATAFEDHFAPFVPATTSFIPDEFGEFTQGPTAGSGGGREGFERLEDGGLDSLGREGGDEGGDLSEGDDGLEELVARLKGMREEARGLGLDERRALAERAVLGLLGE